MGLRKYMGLIAAVLSLVITLVACAKAPPVDPYEGMAQVPNGLNQKMWIDIIDELEVSEFSADEFYHDSGYIDYKGSRFNALRGIDVSEHQEEIDWSLVAADGVEFAIIRAGYRGYSEGTLNEDKFFRQNIEGALGAGLKVGIYFFSQSVSASEARQEAEYLLGLIEGYDISLPVFFDWEPMGNIENTRTEDVEGSELTDFALAFCDVVKGAGYETGVYFYRTLGYYEYELGRLAGLVFWSAAPGVYPDFYYEHDIWQYSYTGRVSGILKDTDLNIYFEKLPESQVAES